MKKVLISTLAVLFLVTSCGKVPTLKNGEDAIVTMKGDDISVNSFYNDLKEKYGLNILINKIDTEILNSLYKTDDEEKNSVKSQLESIKYYYESYLKSQYSSFNEYLTANGVSSEEELKENLALEYKKDKAITRYAKTLVTEKEINKYYKDEIFGDISASHILIAPDVKDDATDEEKTKAEKAALKEAKNIITKLKNGEKFEDLAKKYSDDTQTKSSGGKLADFNHGQMVDEFEKAARDLKVGKYTTTPVKTEYGYHIIYKTAQKDKPALKDVKDEIVETLAKDKITDKIKVVAMDKLRKEYKVEIQDETMKKLYKNYIENNT